MSDHETKPTEEKRHIDRKRKAEAKAARARGKAILAQTIEQVADKRRGEPKRAAESHALPPTIVSTR